MLTVGTTTATYSVTTAGAGSRDWIPTDLGSKLALWVRPEGLTGADTTSITAWNDASGNSKNLSVAASRNAPAVQALAINGLKAAKFAGVGSGCALVMPSSSTYLSGRTSMATFFVSKNNADPNPTYYGAPIASFGTETGDFWCYTNGGVYTGYGKSARVDNMDAPGVMTNWHQFMLQSAPNDWRFAQDGADVNILTSNAVSLGTSPQFGSSSGIGSPFDGLLAEIVDLNAAPTTTERQLVEGYLAWKFGLQANLPAGHPYLAAKPTI